MMVSNAVAKFKTKQDPPNLHHPLVKQLISLRKRTVGIDSMGPERNLWIVMFFSWLIFTLSSSKLSCLWIGVVLDETMMKIRQF